MTDYTVHAQRGQTAMDDAGGSAGFKGRAMHDHWKPYFGYEACRHAPVQCAPPPGVAVYQKPVWTTMGRDDGGSPLGD
ncbi:MAG: hypothetical protein IPL99_22010 [Candidatus Competibacteraceae bacterium]|nr:hypothetical protein [Candidatus Competibacteraceae bacterium]